MTAQLPQKARRRSSQAKKQTSSHNEPHRITSANVDVASDALHTLLAVADHSVSVLTAADVAAWPKNFAEAALAMRLLKRIDNARHVECDQCANHHHAEVFDGIGADGKVRFFYICEDAGQVAVDERRLFQWRVDMTHLVRAFAESIGAAGSPEVLGYDRIWRLGSVIVEDKAFSAVLLRGAAWADAPQAIQQSLKTLPAEKTLLFMLSNAHIDMPTGFGAVIPAQSVLHFRGGKLLIDFARIRAAVGGPDVALDMPVVSDANASVHYRNKQCSFSSRAGDLLALFKRLNRRPGTHVLFATMRHTGDIYGDCAVEDASIRSALTRLRTHFRRNKMAKLAQCLKTGTGDAGPYAVLDLSEYNNSH